LKKMRTGPNTSKDELQGKLVRTKSKLGGLGKKFTAKGRDWLRRRRRGSGERELPELSSNEKEKEGEKKNRHRSNGTSLSEFEGK